MAFSFNLDNNEILESILNKKRHSKSDKKYLREYFNAIVEFVSKEEKDYQKEHNLEDDEIDWISGFLDVRLNILLGKEKLRPIEREELRALYHSAKWHVITSLTKTQSVEVEEELKKTNLRGLRVYHAPWKWSFYWP